MPTRRFEAVRRLAPQRLLANAAVSLLALVAVASSTAATMSCPGDCDATQRIEMVDLLRGIDIALGKAGVNTCSSFDIDQSGAVEIDDLIAVCDRAGQGCPQIDLIFPADYRASFTEVRTCRIGLEHDSYRVRAWANEMAVQPYLDHQNPLPEGSIVIKEEFDGNDCSDDSKLVRWSVMRKEAPGFDPVDADWHWQRVRRDGSVIADGKATCVGCHRVPACLARDYMCLEPGPAPAPKLVLQDLPAALLSVTGTSASDVYAVGADPPNDNFGPYFLHFDGNRWQRLNTGATGTLWWVSVTPIDGSLYMAGENGLILQFDLTTRQFTRHVTPGTPTIFGIWGTRADSIWAVGGDRNASDDSNGFIWHYDGTTWKAEDLSGIDPNGIPLRFKVWGRADDDVYAVGQRGMILHYDGTGWAQITSNSIRPLITVHGNATETVAVGGFGDGVVLERVGNEFVNRTPRGSKQLSGVFLNAQGGGVSVGNEGEVQRRTNMGWEIQTPANTVWDFHGVWVDPEGGFWATGGDLIGDLDRGILAYSGPRTIPSTVVDIDPCPPGDFTGPTTVSFSSQISPLLNQAGCKGVTCHVGPFPASSYSQARYDLMFRQGVSAKILNACPIVPGDPDASFLVEKLGANPRLGLQMPAAGSPLTEPEIDLIRTWILEGARNN